MNRRREAITTPVTVGEAEALSKKRLPKDVYDYCACSADDRNPQGIMTEEDAHLGVEHGADAIIVSRQAATGLRTIYHRSPAFDCQNREETSISAVRRKH